MTRLRVHSFSISLDGYGAGPRQDAEHPLGIGGGSLHEWIVATRTFKQLGKQPGGTTGADDDFVKRGFAGIGAWIIGRNMFGPVRGPWLDDSWKGWWGSNPPYHCAVFILTHHARAPIMMEGGTEFRFVTGGIHAALKEATAAAEGKDIRLGGGASVIRQFLQAKLVDELNLAIVPALLGAGEHFFVGIDAPALGYRCSEHVPTAGATHVVLTR